MSRPIPVKPRFVTDETGEPQMVLLDLADYHCLLELAYGRLADATAMASGFTLARIWDNPLEDEAWRDL